MVAGLDSNVMYRLNII